MDYLREQQANAILEKNKNGFVPADVCGGMELAVDAFMNFTVQAPAAYSVDSVVGQLRELNENEFTYSRVMQIVKGGGLDGKGTAGSF